MVCHRFGVSPILLGLSVSIYIVAVWNMSPPPPSLYRFSNKTLKVFLSGSTVIQFSSPVKRKRNQKPAGESDRTRSRRLIITTHTGAQVNLLLAPMSAPWTPWKPWTPSLGQQAQSVTQACLFVFRFYLRTSYLWSVLRISLLESRAD